MTENQQRYLQYQEDVRANRANEFLKAQEVAVRESQEARAQDLHYSELAIAESKAAESQEKALQAAKETLIRDYDLLKAVRADLRDLDYSRVYTKLLEEQVSQERASTMIAALKAGDYAKYEDMLLEEGLTGTELLSYIKIASAVLKDAASLVSDGAKSTGIEVAE